MPINDKPKPTRAGFRVLQLLFAAAMLVLILTSATLLWQGTRPEPLEIRVIPPPPPSLSPLRPHQVRSPSTSVALCASRRC